jgi:hypothetical protein
MGAFDRGRRKRPGHTGATILTVIVALGTAVTLLLLVTIIVLIATSPNWVGH